MKQRTPYKQAINPCYTAEITANECAFFRGHTTWTSSETDSLNTL
jgi:hypothetical protein